MFQEGTNGLYFYGKFEVLTTYSYGDIDQNRLKISVFRLGTETHNICSVDREYHLLTGKGS